MWSISYFLRDVERDLIWQAVEGNAPWSRLQPQTVFFSTRVLFIPFYPVLGMFVSAIWLRNLTVRKQKSYYQSCKNCQWNVSKFHLALSHFFSDWNFVFLFVLLPILPFWTKWAECRYSCYISRGTRSTF